MWKELEEILKNANSVERSLFVLTDRQNGKSVFNK